MNEVGTSQFPPELFNEILMYSKSNLLDLVCVSKKFQELTKKCFLNYYPEGCFDRKDWLKYNVTVEEMPGIPLNMIQDFDASKFMLTFIPETLNGEIITFINFDQFLNKHRSFVDTRYYGKGRNFEFFVDAYDELFKNDKARWVMLSKELLEGTRGESFEIQEKLVKEKGFEIPKLIDTVMSLLMHQLKTGEYLYRISTYTHVKEETKVGFFTEGGLSVLNLTEPKQSIGTACARTTIKEKS